MRKSNFYLHPDLYSINLTMKKTTTCEFILIPPVRKTIGILDLLCPPPSLFVITPSYKLRVVV